MSTLPATRGDPPPKVAVELTPGMGGATADNVVGESKGKGEDLITEYCAPLRIKLELLCEGITVPSTLAADSAEARAALIVLACAVQSTEPLRVFESKDVSNSDPPTVKSSNSKSASPPIGAGFS